MPTEGFKIYGNADDTLKVWARQLNYLFKNLDNANVASTTLTLGANQVKASNIDFGVGANQVDASDIPSNASTRYASGTVEGQLSELSPLLLSTGFPSTNIAFVDSTTIVAAPLSTGIAGTTTLAQNVALVSDLNATNGLLNQLRQALVSNGILST